MKKLEIQYTEWPTGKYWDGVELIRKELDTEATLQAIIDRVNENTESIRHLEGVTLEALLNL